MSKANRKKAASATSLVLGLSLAYVLAINGSAWWGHSLSQPVATRTDQMRVS
jgi:hypothetical protein